MGEVGVHDDDVIPGRPLDAVNVGSTEAELLLPRSQNYFVGTVNLLQALCNLGLEKDRLLEIGMFDKLC
jgi:hypothetical protein